MGALSGLSSAGDERGRYYIEDFSQICRELIKQQGERKFGELINALAESAQHHQKNHEVYWQGWALWVDTAACVVLPLGYSVGLVVLWSYKRNFPDPSFAAPVTSIVY